MSMSSCIYLNTAIKVQNTVVSVDLRKTTVVKSNNYESEA